MPFTNAPAAVFAQQTSDVSYACAMYVRCCTGSVGGAHLGVVLHFKEEDRMRTTRKIATATMGAAAMLALAAGPALADGGVNANLKPVPGNGVAGSGTAMVQVTGTTMTVTMAASGLLANQPHAAHIHFGADARHECPTLGDDTNKDGHLNTTEGGPAYGPVVVSLTKTGDTSPKSGVAVDRFASGTSIQYMRGDVTVEPDVASAVEKGQAVAVVHGVTYTGDQAAAKSDLVPTLPASATDPAICGVLSAAPSGGAATGAGGAAATQDGALIGLGGAALVGAAGAGLLVARRVRG